MGCFIPDGVDEKAPVKSEVIMDRTWSSPIIAAVALLYVLATFILACYSASVFPTPEPCVGPEKWATSKAYLLNQTAQFFISGGNGFAEVITDHPESMGLAIGMVFGSVILLFVGFRFLPKLTTWGLSLLSIVIWIAMGVYLLVEFKADIGYALLVMAAIFIAVLIFKRSAINEAAILFKMSTYCIVANPGMLGMTLIIQICLILMATLMIAGIVSAAFAGTFMSEAAYNALPLDKQLAAVAFPINITDTTSILCYYGRSSWAKSAYTFLSFSFGYMMLNFKMIRLYMVSVTTALWYWETPENRRSCKSCLGLKWALSYGFGVVASAAIIIAIVDQVVRTTTSKMSTCLNCCNPLFWICWVLVQVYKEVMYALATFSMIIGAITGEGFCLSATRALYTLKGRFSTLFVVSGVSRTVVFGFANMVAFCAFLAAFNMTGVALGCPPLYARDFTTLCPSTPNATDPIEGGTIRTLYQLTLVFVGLISVKYAIVSIFLVLLLATVDSIAKQGADWLLAMFVGSVANYLLTYMAEVLLDVVNSLFAIAEIDRKNGVVPGENCAEGTPGAFASYYYTEMSKMEQTNVGANSVQTGGVAVAVAIPIPMTGQPVAAGVLLQGQPAQGQVVQGYAAGY